jgi:WD40 repeat protein
MLILEGHTRPVKQVCFSPDGAMLLSVARGNGGGVRLWDLRTREAHPWFSAGGSPR